jgi:hypothetical protein
METDPISGPSFFGRDELLLALEKRTQAFLNGYRQNVGLVGKKGVGKSSLILHFLSRLDDKSLIAIYLEVQPEPLDAFAQKFMAAVLAGGLKTRGEDVPQDFNTIVLRGKRYFPRTLARMREIRAKLARSEWNAAFQELVGLTQQLREESGKKVLLALDNFDLLEDLGFHDAFHKFGKAMMLQTDTLYLVAASNERKARDIFAEKLSLLFGNFEVLPVDSFDFASASAFLHLRLPNLSFPERLKKFLIFVTDGHPYGLDVLAEGLKRVAQQQDTAEVTEDLLIRVLEEELYRSTGPLHAYFLLAVRQLGGRGRVFHASLKVLVAIALGCHKAPAMAKSLRRPLDEVKKTLARLVEDEVIEKRGSFFTLSLSLFRFWLRYCHARKEWGFLQAPSLATAGFREEMRAVMRAYAVQEDKELTKRVEELFRCFSNDVVELEHRKVKCPHFSEVIFKPSNGRVFPVEAKGHSTRWICQVAHTKVSEDDVRLFIQDIHKLRRKAQRKVMIAVEGTELNAKLVAKEAQILVWNLRNLNTLFDLYGQAKVIR